MLNIAIAGISGRMGQSIYQCLQEHPAGKQLTLATTLPADPNLGKTAGAVLGGDSEVIITDTLNENFDVLIDFTSPEATLAHLRYCQQHHKAIVIGTTGFSEEQLAGIHQAAKKQAIFLSANMSVGVNIMQQLVVIAAKALHRQADIEIVETHHKHKVDAPSGTALMLGRAIADGIGMNLAEHAIYAREGITGERPDGSIGFSTIRGGDVVGEHTAYYYMLGERVEISHRATDRRIFARGALFAANFIARQDFGLYNMSDALGLNE